MPRKGWVSRATFAAGALLLAAFALSAWFIAGDRSLPASPRRVDIAAGESVQGIARQLAADGIVRSGLLLVLAIRLEKPGATVEAAEYAFPAHLTVLDVARIVLAGGRPEQVWITIPEGFTARDIAARLARAGIRGASDFVRAVRTTDLTLDGWRIHGCEGYLFPDTYLVPRDATAGQIIRLMTSNFVRHLPPDAAQQARRLHVTLPQVVTIASMVEREAKVDAERPLIAAVIYNRLHAGMRLEVDATVEYALPHHKPVLSLHDLEVNSPYNTYRHGGLPPGPIANPGRKSLLAALHPAGVEYLYYVYRGHGRHAFSRTFQEQQAAERRYLR
jgi:UPF0755 protein